MRKFNLLSTCIALALTTQLVVAAEVDLLNLDSRSVGDTSLGDHVIISQDIDTSAKYITGDKGELGQVVAPINMSSGSEVRIKVKLTNNAAVNLSLLADEYKIELSIHPITSSLTGNALALSANDRSGAWITGYNTIKLALIGDEVKVYVNDIFSQKARLVNTNLIFNQLKLSYIHSYSVVAIYELKIRGDITTASCSGSSTTTTPVSGTTNTGDLAQIASNLDIKIPRGLYSQSGGLFTPAGSIPVWADLKYNAGGNYWTLSGAGILPQ